MNDCDDIMTFGLIDVSYMSFFNNFDETVTYGKDMFHGWIIDDFSMVTIHSILADNHESTLGTGINDLEKDTGAHTNLYSGQVEEAFGFLGNFIDPGNITTNISGSNCDCQSCVEDELLSSCDTKETLDDETNSNCDTKEKVDNETSSICDICLIEDDSVRLGGMNSMSLDHNHTSQPFCLQNDFCDIDAVQNCTCEDMKSCSGSGSNKPSDFQKIWSILSDILNYGAENMPTWITYTPSQGYHFKGWKAKQELYDASNYNIPCRDNNHKY